MLRRAKKTLARLTSSSRSRARQKIIDTYASNIYNNKAPKYYITPATHKPACAVHVKFYSFVELDTVRRRLWAPCTSSNGHGVTKEYVDLLLDEYENDRSAFALTAEDDKGKVRGFVCGRILRHRVDLGIVCTKDPSNKTRECKNVSVLLMFAVENLAREYGVRLITLDAVASAVKFYARLGYTRQRDACNPDKLADAQAREQFDARFSDIVHSKGDVSNAVMKYLGYMDRRYFPKLNKPTTFYMTKCVKK